MSENKLTDTNVQTYHLSERENLNLTLILLTVNDNNKKGRFINVRKLKLF